VMRDYHDLLTLDTVQAVSVCLPDFLHHEVVTAAAAAGKHVLCEKPLAMDVAEADDMLAACREAGVHLGLVMNHRYSRGNLRARMALSEGMLGTPLVASVLHSSGLTGNSDGRSPWRGRAGRAAGGVLSTQAIHFLDLLLWFLGPVAAVKAWTAKAPGSEQDHEDSAVLALSMKSGAMATVTTTSASPIMDDLTGTRIEIHGSDGWLLLDGDHLTRIETMAGTPPPEVSLPDLPPEADDLVFGTGHVYEVMDFVDAVRRGDQPPVPGVDGRHLMAVVHAAYRSALEDAEIDVHEPSPAYAVPAAAASLLGGAAIDPELN
jgi:UDP-N-acetyl-2-amino-2-deoxyglucuronate dehydrogenase